MQGDGVWTSVRELPVAMEYLGGVSLNNHILMTGKTRVPASRSSSVGPKGRFSFFHPKVKVKKTISLTSFVFHSEQSESRNSKFSPLKSLLVGWFSV